MQQKKVPMRQCLGCRQMFTKRELLRIVHSKDGEISQDMTGKKPGRGAYICRQAACLQKIRKSRALERAFGCTVPDEIFEALHKEMEDSSI